MSCSVRKAVRVLLLNETKRTWNWAYNLQETQAFDTVEANRALGSLVICVNM